MHELKNSLFDRAENALQSGKLEEAEILYRQLIAHIEYLLGHVHLDMAVALHGLAQVLEKKDEHEEAFATRQKASAILKKLER